MKIKSIVFYFFLFTFLIGCSQKNNDPDNSFGQILDNTNTIKETLTIIDTALYRYADSGIDGRILKSIVPDSVFRQIKVSENAIIKVIGNINNKNEEEIYLVIVSKDDKKASIHSILFNEEGKYLNVLPLISSESKNGYNHVLTISSEPTFGISKQKYLGDELKYTRNIYAYNHDAGMFMVVVHDSNEEKLLNTQPSFVNPLDTFPANNVLSGNYIKDEHNILTLRDGKNENSYLFFIHFNKKKDCNGELKGEIEFNDKKAVFTKNGDPCVMDFQIVSKEKIKVKERGSCGNHRGIVCFFDDVYTRNKMKKENKK